ncbi:MAG: hypothetical protein QXN86_02235 [Candidatus Methanomethylicaceae archaeon]
MSFTIYYEAKQEGLWFQSLSDKLGSAKMKVMEEYGGNPSEVDDLVAYDLPDIILVQDNEPKLVLEKTEEVPTGHNVGQRFARLVRAAERGVISVYFLPFAAMKHGRYANPCWVNARLFEAMFRVWEIHGVPALAVEWSHDGNYELVRDGTENQLLRMLIDELLLANFAFTKVKLVDQLRERMKQATEKALERYKGYGEPPKSIKILPTKDFVDSLQKQFRSLDLPEHLIARGQSLIYTIRMSEGKCRREDPYTGMQLVYDYYLCRNGPTKHDRHTNLIVSFPEISKEVWLRENPFDRQRKRRLWYIVPDLLIFKDAILDPERVITGKF